MQTTSTFAVSIVQSRLFGDDKGTAFNDIETVGGYPGDMTIDVDHPISSILVLYGDVIDGLSITYNETAGGTETVSHGTKPTSTHFPREEFTLSADENIITITGKTGVHPIWGKRVCQLSFVIYNRLLGLSRIAGPYGTGDHGTPFRVTTNGAFVAFGGYDVTGNDSIGTATHAGRPGGLYGLTFADVDYRQA